MPYQPTSRAAAALALAGGGCLVHPVLGLAAAACVAAAGAVDAVLAESRAPEARRTVPNVVVRGIEHALRVEAVGPGVELTQPGTAELAVGGSLPGALTLRALRRGRHVLPPLQARVAGPLGLASWSGAVSDPAEIEVHPDVRATRRFARTSASTRFDDEGGRVRGPLGLGTAFESLRDYATGDDVRLVNWKATARAGRPIVNQFRMEQSRDVVLLVDVGRVHHGPAAAEVHDAVVTAAAALAQTVDAIGDRCGALAFADHPITQLVPRSGGGRAAAKAINAVATRSVDSDYEVAFRSLAMKRAVVVIFTDLVDDLAAAALIGAIPVLARRHQVLVVAGERPVVRPAGDRTPAEVLAATLLREERDRAISLLRRSGASVVSAPPDRLPAAACRAYLDAKGRARG